MQRRNNNYLRYGGVVTLRGRCLDNFNVPTEIVTVSGYGSLAAFKDQRWVRVDGLDNISRFQLTKMLRAINAKVKLVMISLQQEIGHQGKFPGITSASQPTDTSTGAIRTVLTRVPQFQPIRVKVASTSSLRDPRHPAFSAQMRLMMSSMLPHRQKYNKKKT
ncbi:hypothetical protein K470DRAFT_254573 [Piedraia hortae CBS 480.64]|uniref:Uncharacterized protein n=1 Tax=Piedraia hortae CBS 480.64 TaxID=1314780 RepID=A0A6A7CAL6_9PEZI|nr:hypothetical protein K470DRAFT_254573 [Piedraia hortae CBS 480.64]